MWKGKILELKKDLQELKSLFKKKIFKDITRDKLTPLEFTILESIFNNKAFSGYDLIQYLTQHFAGQWEAHSGTVYPILSRMKADGFLDVKEVKSPLGPLRKVYYLTEAGEAILKFKVSKGFLDQLKFIENFLIDFSAIYIHTFPEEKQEEQIVAVQEEIKKTLENVIREIPSTVDFKKVCPSCKAAIDRSDATYCPFCGSPLFGEQPTQPI
jgi:DNA-binding PadR family transcriptional regulator